MLREALLRTTEEIIVRVEEQVELLDRMKKEAEAEPAPQQQAGAEGAAGAAGAFYPMYSQKARSEEEELEQALA